MCGDKNRRIFFEKKLQKYLVVTKKCSTFALAKAKDMAP